jgi:hypothetical protein
MPYFGKVMRVILGTNKTGSLVLPKRDVRTPSRYLAVVAIVKNEGRYLKEWLEFQRLVGVEHVYLYDNGSTDHFAAVTAPFAAEGFVTIIPWSFPWYLTDQRSPNAQALAFFHAIFNFGPDWRWMTFIDVDEFLFPLSGLNLRNLLKDYEDLPALVTFWTMFGPSGHLTPPPGLVIENYTKCAPFPTDARPKSIVDPSAVLEIRNVHMFDTTAGKSAAYNEHRQLVTRENLGKRTSDIFRLNHYYTRSQTEFQAKVADKVSRRFKSNAINKGPRWGLVHLSADTVPDDAILRFVPELKRRLATTCLGSAPIDA